MTVILPTGPDGSDPHAGLPTGPDAGQAVGPDSGPLGRRAIDPLDRPGPGPVAGVGITALAAYLPWYRLTAAEIARSYRWPALRRPAQRRVAGHDEDAVTMSVEAARRLPARLVTAVTSVIMCTATPPYAAKNNASAAHAALALPGSVPAWDLGGSLRSAAGLLATAAPGTLLLCADVTAARPGAAAELDHGDAAAAILLGPVADAVAEIAATASVTDEVLDHWRLPAEPWLSVSEDRFPVSRYESMMNQVLGLLAPREVQHVIVSTPSARVRQAVSRRLAGTGPVRALDSVGYAGSADLAVRLCAVLRDAAPGDYVLAVSLTDGCDALLLRCTDRLPAARPAPLPAAGDGAEPTYLDALSWRGLLTREPPRRPAPAPVSPPASARRTGWKYALHGSVCAACAAVASPPQRVCVRCGSAAAGEPVDLSRRSATIRTFSVDRLAYSPNPPVIAAIVDFDGGGRLEVELTDTAPDQLAVGQRVRMSFRRRHSSGGIHNYAWKAVPEEQGHG